MRCTVRAGLIALAMAATVLPCRLEAQVTLTAIVELAQRNSSSVKLAEADVKKASASLAQTRDAYYPNLVIGSTVGYSYGFPTGQPSIGSANMQSLVLSFSQGQYIKAARAGLNAANLALKDAREQVALDASTAYIELDTVSTEIDAAQKQEAFADSLIHIEQQRAEAGVDSALDLLQARLTGAQLKVKRLRLESRAATLSKQLAVLTGLPVDAIKPEHASIPEIPAVKADEPSRTTAGLESAGALASSKQFQAKGDYLAATRPQIGFGAVYNYDSDELNNYSYYYRNFTPNNVSFGIEIQIPLFDLGQRAKARVSAADALRAKVEAEQAQQQNDVQIATLSGSLRELDALAEVAGLKQEIAAEQLKVVMTQLDLGNGASSGPNPQPQTTPKAEQLARIDERQKYQEALDASLELSKARLNLLRALGHMDDWLRELQGK
jgi:outer membrane protein TolC